MQDVVQQSPTLPDTPIIECPECLATFRQTRRDRRYCGRTCTTAATNRMAIRGRMVWPLLVRWRSTRGEAKRSLGDVAAFVDQCLTEDRIRLEERRKGIEDAQAD